MNSNRVWFSDVGSLVSGDRGKAPKQGRRLAFTRDRTPRRQNYSPQPVICSLMMITRMQSLSCVAALAALFVNSGARAETIEFCGGLYRYVDIEFMKVRPAEGCIGTRWPRAGEALGWTYSTTPPGANVEFIEEHATVCFSVGPEVERIVSRGRKVPRYRVTGKPHEWGNYVRSYDGRKEGCEDVEYNAPATARRPSAEHVERSAPLLLGPVHQGVPRVTYTPVNLVVNRESIRLYGVIPNSVRPRDREIERNAAAQLLRDRIVNCREVDLGGHQCLLDGVDLSVLFVSRQLARPHTIATLRIHSAAEGAPIPMPAGGLAAPGTVPGVQRQQTPECERLARAVNRARALPPQYEDQLRQAQQRYARNCPAG
jgi:hypothetical protein